jgi:hypothetical protein
MEFTATVKVHLSGGRTLMSVLLPGYKSPREIEVPTAIVPAGCRAPGSQFTFDPATMAARAAQGGGDDGEPRDGRASNE